MVHSSTFLLFLAMDELTRQLASQRKKVTMELYKLLSWSNIQRECQALGLLSSYRSIHQIRRCTHIVSVSSKDPNYYNAESDT